MAYRIRKAGRGACLGFVKFKPSFGEGYGTKVFLPISKKALNDTNRSSVLPMQCSSEALVVPNTFFPESLLSKGKNVNVTPEDPAATSELKRCRSLSRSAQAAIARSNGESREGSLQRSPPSICHREVLTQFAKGAAEAQGNSSQSHVL